jgi:hypothetical protein
MLLLYFFNFFVIFKILKVMPKYYININKFKKKLRSKFKNLFNFT